MRPIATDTGPVRLTQNYGFVNEYDATYFKPAGSVITNPVEIYQLRKRLAPIEDVPSKDTP